jgi:hypothetical protein
MKNYFVERAAKNQQGCRKLQSGIFYFDFNKLHVAVFLLGNGLRPSESKEI